MTHVYKINLALRIALIVSAVLLLALMILSLASGAPVEQMILTALLVVTAIVAVEASERVLIFSEDGLEIRKYFRTKQFSWAEITQLGFMVMRSKVYFLLTTTRGFYIFSNLLKDHSALVKSLADRLGSNKVEPEIQSYLEHPIERKSIVILMWLAVAILLAILITKLLKLY